MNFLMIPFLFDTATVIMLIGEVLKTQTYGFRNFSLAACAQIFPNMCIIIHIVGVLRNRRSVWHNATLFHKVIANFSFSTKN